MKPVNKTEALKKLAELETEFKKQTDGLRKIIDTPENVIDRINSYESACEDLNIDPIESLPYRNPKTNREKSINAFHMLDIISEALLEGKKLDWADSDQQKHFPYFNNYTPGSGFRFGGTGCSWAIAGASGGARLCVDTEPKAKHFGSHPNFLPIWKQFLNPNK